ncbi:MAG: DoxX family protein [Pyrinomonadaceae bacterium]|nr:DoxX family protein [Pyrinomonadaceae bacterium]
MFDSLTKWSPKILSVLRFISGFLIFWHGSQKILGFPEKQGGGKGALMLTAGILELTGGTLLALGLFTRPTAFILSGLMAVAYFMSHSPNGFLPLVNRGELAVLYCFVFFYFFFAGGGDWSLDRALTKKK